MSCSKGVDRVHSGVYDEHMTKRFRIQTRNGVLAKNSFADEASAQAFCDRVNVGRPAHLAFEVVR